MTLIVSWIAVDDKPHGKEISAIYIAADSRYTWGNNTKFDNGVKVFGSTKYPEIFGFCGDVLFPSIVLGQIIPQIDNGILFRSEDNSIVKNEKIYQFVKTSLKYYPRALINKNFSILHASRYKKSFKLFRIHYSKKKGLSNVEINLPKVSRKVFSGGSGKDDFEANWIKWLDKDHNNFQTSRGVYHCLDTTLENTKDKFTGGLPQIIGLFRAKNSQIFGIIKDDNKYILGKKSIENVNWNKIEWRNENFERINPETLKLIEGAQKQPK